MPAAEMCFFFTEYVKHILALCQVHHNQVLLQKHHHCIRLLDLCKTQQQTHRDSSSSLFAHFWGKKNSTQNWTLSFQDTSTVHCFQKLTRSHDNIFGLRKTKCSKTKEERLFLICLLCVYIVGLMILRRLYETKQPELFKYFFVYLFLYQGLNCQSNQQLDIKGCKK